MFFAKSGCCQWIVCFLGSFKSYFTSHYLTAASLSSCIFDMSSFFIDMVALVWSFCFQVYGSILGPIFVYYMETFFLFYNERCIYLPLYLFFFYFLVVALHRCSYFNKMKFFSGQATDKRFVWERYHIQSLDQSGVLAIHRHISSSWYKIVFLSEFFWP